MPVELTQRLSSIAAKARILAERYHRVEQERDEARRLAADLQERLNRSLLENQRLTQQVEYLQVASVIEQSRESLDSTRDFLNGLVWEIDKCITQLSE